MKKFKRSKSSKKELKSSKRKFFSKQTVWAVGIVLIMVLSVIGFMYVAPSEEEYDYAGITFTPVMSSSGSVGYWIANINGTRMSFYNHPYDVDFINVSEETKGVLSSSKIFYITSDADDYYKEDISLMNFQLDEELSPAGFIFIPGFTLNNTFERPVVTCDNATTTMPVLYIKSGKNDSITSIANCVTLEFSTQLNSRRFKDRLTLGLLEIEE